MEKGKERTIETRTRWHGYTQSLFLLRGNQTMLRGMEMLIVMMYYCFVCLTCTLYTVFKKT